MTAGSLLVVDDNEANRDVLSRRLRQRGYDVDVAVDGYEALAVIEHSAYDLILLDVEMPGLSGLDVLGRLRASRPQIQLPIIMVTARSQGTDIVEAFGLGANDYVTKPIDFPVALARIATHLSHKRAVERLHESEERYALAMQGANDGLWDWNLTTNEVYWSVRWKAMLGYDEPELTPSPDEWFTRVHPDDMSRVKDALAAHLAHGTGHYECEHRMLHRDGRYRWVLCRGAAIRTDAGVATRLAGSLTDVTGAKIADPLTGLPNRLLFEDLLDRAIKRAKRRGDYRFALLALGLDRFDAFNDSLGRPSADRLLIAVAGRLQHSLRSTDAVSRRNLDFTLARLGGDEFTVLVDDMTDADDAVRVAERLRSAIVETPFDVDGQQVFAAASVGIAISTTGYHSPEQILRDAVIALHRAKCDGGARSEVFDPVMRERAITRLQIETDLRQAIDASAFAVHYQPIISLATGDIVAFEALARCQHPTRGLLNPADFIGVAEDTGMILQIGRLMLSKSCRQMADWQRRFGPDAPRVICVNVSSRQFADPELAKYIESTLQETGLEASSLKLEITETAFLRDLLAARITISSVQSMGVEWSLDDFGTGYSSFSYLHKLHVATLKIDRAFVNRVGQGRSGSEMVRAIVALGHNLGLDVVAEGVETLKQLAELRVIGCEYAQGFYFSKPVDAASAERLIKMQPWRETTCAIRSAAASGQAV